MNQLVKASSASGVTRRASSRLMRHFSIRRTEQLRVRRQARATAEPDKLELGETRARLLPRTRVPFPGLAGVSQ